MVRDGNLRAGLYDKVKPLLRGLPGSLAAQAKAKQLAGRFLRRRAATEGSDSSWRSTTLMRCFLHAVRAIVDYPRGDSFKSVCR